MHLKARTELTTEDGGPRYVKFAGTKRIVLPEKLQKIVGVSHRAIRTEIGPGLAIHPPGKEYSRELLICNHYPRIGLGVLQKAIVVGFVLLYQVVLQQQRVSLRINHRELSVRDLGDQDPCLNIEPLGRHKILRHTFMEVLSLTHINHLPRGIVIAINPRGMWKQGYFLPDS